MVLAPLDVAKGLDSALRPSSLQVSVLEDLSVPGRKVCVANTHLYWHPKGTPTLSLLDAAPDESLVLWPGAIEPRRTRALTAGGVISLLTGGNIRLLQMGVALKHLDRVMADAAPGAPLVFCGDFNSSPDSGNSGDTGVPRLMISSTRVKIWLPCCVLVKACSS